MNLFSKARLILSFGLMGAAMPSIAADEKVKEPFPAAAQTAKPVSPAATASPAVLPVAKASAAPVAAKPVNNPDQDMSEALVKKINKGSGDIVLRSSDLPPPFPVQKTEAKPEVKKADVKEEKKAEAKPKEPPKAETPVI